MAPRNRAGCVDNRDLADIRIAGRRPPGRLPACRVYPDAAGTIGPRVYSESLHWQSLKRAVLPRPGAVGRALIAASGPRSRACVPWPS
jgi:hypothetical protein